MYGLLQDAYTKLNVPNNLLKKDIRDVASKPTKKVYAIPGKKYTFEKCSIIEKCDKRLEIEQISSIGIYMT